VIPVLVRGATMPGADVLPEDLEKLARRNAVELSDNRWDSDVREFISLLDKAMPKDERDEKKTFYPIAGAIAAALITVIAVWLSWPMIAEMTKAERVAELQPKAPDTPAESGIPAKAIEPSPPTTTSSKSPDQAASVPEKSVAPPATISAKPADPPPISAKAPEAASPQPLPEPVSSVSTPAQKIAKAIPGPSLLSPAHNASVDNSCRGQSDKIAWDFSWAQVEGASRYHLYVLGPQAQNPAVNETGLGTTSFHHERAGSHVSDRMLKGWQWKVRAEVNGQWSEWSKTRSFNVEPLDTDCKVVAAVNSSALTKPSHSAPPAVPAMSAENLRPAPATLKLPETRETTSASPASEAKLPTPTPEKIAVAPPSTLPQPPSMPKVGDTWTYRYTSGWRGEKERTFMHKIVGVSPIKETVTMGDNESDIKEFGDSVEVVPRRLPSFTLQEFSPYLQAFTSLETGKTWKAIPALSHDAVIYPWSVQGKVIGPEQISVPAGKFNAVKVELYGNRTADVSRAQAGSIAVRSKHVIWYAPEVKRVVKQTRNTFASNGNDLDKDIFELVEYKLN
jgi:hypothetical protein